MSTRLIIACMVGLTAVSTDLYLPGIPAMVTDLNGNTSQGQWTLSVFVLGSAFGQLIYGSLSDYFGRKPTLTVGLCIFLLASIACASVQGIEAMVVARFFQGLGAAAGPVLARAIVNDQYSGVEATQLMATIAGSMAILPAVAPIIGSALLLIADWRSHFVLLALFGLFTFFGSRKIPESCPSIGLGKLQLSRVFKQFPQSFANKRFSGFALCGGSLFGAMFCYISSASYLITDLLHVDPTYFGYTFACVVFGYIIGAMLCSRKINSWGQLRLLTIGQFCAWAGGLLLLIQAYTGHVSLLGVITAVTLIFLANGLSLSISQMAAIREFPLQAGAASAVFGFVQLIGGALCSFLVGQAYNGSAMPVAIGMACAIILSSLGYLIIRQQLKTA